LNSHIARIENNLKFVHTVICLHEENQNLLNESLHTAMYLVELEHD